MPEPTLNFIKNKDYKVSLFLSSTVKNCKVFSWVKCYKGHSGLVNVRFSFAENVRESKIGSFSVKGIKFVFGKTKWSFLVHCPKPYHKERIGT